MMQNEVDVDEQRYASRVLNQLNSMREDSCHCDFVIKIGSVEIPVHRNVLSATSDYFRAMFKHNNQENLNGMVTMQDIDLECMKICIKFMYTGKASIPGDKYDEFMYVATLLELHQLRDAIIKMMEKNLDVKTFFMIRRIVDKYECSELQEKCDEFAQHNLDALSLEEEFGMLDEEYVRKLIGSSHTVSEKAKLDSILRWTKSDPSRTESLSSMFQLVCLGRIPAGYRRYLIEEDALVFENNEVLRNISISVMDSLRLRSACRETQYENGICVFDKASGVLWKYVASENKWSSMHTMNEDMKKTRFSVVSINGVIFVLMRSKAVYRLEYMKKGANWERAADMLEDHGTCPPAAILSNRIYVIGGHNLHTTEACEVYAPPTDQWTQICHKCQPSQFAEVFASDNSIYSFGGRIGTNFKSEVLRYDATTDSWSNLTSMHEAKGGVAAIELHNKLYIFGGHCDTDYKELKTVECYDMEADSWSTIEPMMDARSWFKVHCIDGSVYAVGGFTPHKHIEKIDISSGKRERIELPDEMDVWGSVAINV